MRRNAIQKLLFILLAFMLSGIAPVFADDDALETLGLIEPPKEQLVTTSRIPRPTSKIAENITIITADDISRLNAHTLAEVLQTIPGIQLEYLRTPSSFALFNIQGALGATVLVMVDGIRQNDYDMNVAIPGLIPVQNIDRIEIIKGAASTAWGPALGGLINIITKTPDPDRKVSGMVSGSTGSRFTSDSRAELSGTIDRFGYYLTAGNLFSNGLTPNGAANQNNLYGKLSYLLPGKGALTFGMSYLASRPGLDEADTKKWGFVHDNNEFIRSNSFLKFNQPLAAKLSLDIDGYLTRMDAHTKFGGRDDQGAIAFFNDYAAKDTTRGVNGRLNWGDSRQNLVTGFEFGHVQASHRDLLSADPPVYDRVWDHWALFGNGAYTIGELTILSGIRYDHNGISSSATSYTLGTTYQLFEKTTIRAYGAEGYALPSLRGPNNLQKIRVIQSSIESGAIPFLWLKGTYFNNTLRNSQSNGEVATTNQNRQGFEIEARTTPVLGLSLTSGYTYTYVKNTDTGERLQTNSEQSVPPSLVKLALNYDNKDLGLRGALTGNYVWWHSPAGYPSQSTGMIWDLHLNWKLRPAYGMTPELFFSGHNLFNGVQTTDTTLYTNTQRWFNGGLRVNF